MITGHGDPDIATRASLKRLQVQTDLFVYALMDLDAFGVQMLFTYAFGSINMSYDNLGLAVQNIHWIGMFTMDLIDDEKVSSVHISLLPYSERRILHMLMDQEYLEDIIPPYWKERIQQILFYGIKGSMEALHSKLFGHTCTFVKQVIERSLKNKKTGSCNLLSRVVERQKYNALVDRWMRCHHKHLTWTSNLDWCSFLFQTSIARVDSDLCFSQCLK
ncbi:hypothetical protein PVAP13_2NG173503 [Panicum virgatum]|uniref:Topoisomerase 6 subunit A/Spo11 TOPRIM domain-containing protein n=1 Tax=Panicum virgatum TaxID=38727 RepID=A0A8T0VJ32_PANVG|nr:hypothetical protein PVAP13_2NG173503 [Panicum virgatum]